MKPTLKVNDKISMKADIRFLKDTDFGGDNGEMHIGEREVDVHKIYMEYMSPIGKIRVGRTPAAAWQGAYLNNPTNGDRIYLFPKMDKPWGSYVFMQKATENDWYDDHNDSDRDIYEACVYYTTKETKWALGYDYFNNKTSSGIGDVDGPMGVPDGITDNFDRQRHRVKGYVKQMFADVWVEAEVSYDFGDWEDYDTEVVGFHEDTDVDTLAASVAVGTSFDNLKVSALYFYASGDDDDTDDDKESALEGVASDGTGDGFNPYYILTGDHTGMLNSDEYADNAFMATGGVHCIGVSADLAVSDKLTLHGALAYAMSAEDEYRYGSGALDVEEFDDEYGWEIDLGAKYKLLDNLTYEARAAYFDVGDAFGDYKDGGVKVVVDEADDLILLSHHLTMTF